MSGMTSYFIRRLLLVPVTFLVISFMVYAILRIVPGGPIEQAETMMKLAAMSGEGGGGGGGVAGQEGGGLQLTEDAINELKQYYALDRSTGVGYLQWLGVWPREVRHVVPVVDRSAHAEALSRLKDASDAVQEAQESLGTILKDTDLSEADGRIVAPVEEKEVPEDVRTHAKRLWETSFGQRYPLRDLLEPKGLAYDGEHFLRDVPEAKWPQGAGDALAKLRSARADLAKVEDETGYYFDEDKRPLQVAFRPLVELNEVRTGASKRIETLLAGPRAQALFPAPEHGDATALVVYQGRVYREVTKAETRARRAFFDEADHLVEKGYGKRDDLLSFLGKKGFTWQNGTYYREVDKATLAKAPDLFADVEDLVQARRLANLELQRFQDDRHFLVTTDGRIYSLASEFQGIFEGEFGVSYTYNEPVLSLIGRKIPISLWFGLTGYILTWIICVPLGVFKAIKHRSVFDSVTSFVVFLGYSIPGFVLCLILMATIAPKIGLPLGGYLPPDIDKMTWFHALGERIRYMVIPVSGYLVGGFATMTILMKNSLLENLGQDYVRTAFAKGLHEKRVIFVHALRNSLIPITAGIGQALGLLFAGSFLIEKTCNIPGMGLLGFEAVLARDYPIILALLVFLTLIRLVGNIISDIVWALIDPRIRFGR